MQFSRTLSAIHWGAALASLCCALVVTSSAQAIPPHLPFVDEGAGDAVFSRFRADLLSKAQRADYAGVKSMFAANIQSGGGDHGVQRLERKWQISRSPRRLLRELAAVLELGGQFNDKKDEFVAPYVWTCFPTFEDLVSYTVVIHRSTPLFDEPRSTAKILATLSDEVARDGVPTGTGWIPVELVDGRKGFVAEGNLRRPNDYRATFRLIEGRWKLVDFQAGVD